MPASLDDYKGLQVVTPEPSGAGGLAIQDNFKKLVDWQIISVISIYAGDPPPTSPSLGDRYIVAITPAPTGAWTGQGGKVAEYDGSIWLFSNSPQSVYNIEDQRLYIANNQIGPIQADWGGAERGTGAVDLQCKRNSEVQVASGDFSTVSGGYHNTASGLASIISGGYSNLASGSAATVSGGTVCQATSSHSTVAGGSYNTASGYYSTISGGYYNNTSSGYFGNTIGGGYNNTSSGVYPSTVAGGAVNQATDNGTVVSGGTNNSASAQYAAISGGYQNSGSASFASIGGGSDNAVTASYGTIAGGGNNTASGYSSVIAGGHSAVADKAGQFSHAAGSFLVNGDAQVSILIARNGTTNATATNLYLDGSSSRLTIPADTAWVFIVDIVASQQGMANIKKFQRAGVIVNDGGTTSISTVDTIGTDRTIGTPGAWSVSITADNTNDALNISVTGAASTNIRWVARVQLTEVSYPA